MAGKFYSIGLGHKNIMREPWLTLSAGSQLGAEFGPELIKNGMPSETWRSSDYYGVNCAIYGTVDAQDDDYLPTLPNNRLLVINALGVANVNLTPGHGRWRFWANSSTNISATTDRYEEVLPVTIVGSSNASGVVGDINNGYDATTDEVCITPTDYTQDYWVRVRFDAPDNDPQLGLSETSRLQTFWVKVFTGNATPARGDVGVTQHPPRVRGQLWEDGVLKTTLETKVITRGGDGQWVCFQWDADNVSDYTKVELRLDCYRHGIIGDDAEIQVLIDEVIWLCEVDTGSPVAHADICTHWNVYYNVADVLRGITSFYGVRRNVGTVLDSTTHVRVGSPGAEPNTELYSMGFGLEFRDDGCPDFAVWGAQAVDPDGFVEVGEVFLGRNWTPEHDSIPGDLRGSESLSKIQETGGGQKFGGSSITKGKMRLILPALTDTEAMIVDDTLRRYGGMRSFFAGQSDEVVSTNQHLTTGPWVVRQMPSVSYTYNEDYPRSMDIDLEEWR